MIDLHTQRAAELFGVAPEDVTPDQRRYAKRRNYIDAYSSPVLLSTLYPKTVPQDCARRATGTGTSGTHPGTDSGH